MTNKKKILGQKDIDNWETCENGVKIFPEHSEFDDGCEFGNRCEFGDWCEFGRKCKFDDDCVFGRQCKFPAYYIDGRLVNTCMFGNHCAFMQEVKIDNEKQRKPQAKFTPGPWEAGRNPAMATVLDNREGKAIYQKGKGGCRHIGWANIHDDEGKLDMDTALANAALIAAAPEMYALLDRLSHALFAEDADEWAYEIKSLLAKARGEAETCKG